MDHPVQRRRAPRSAVLVASVVATGVGIGALLVAPSATANIGGTLYVANDTAAARWVAANSSDPRAQVIKEQIVSRPSARWVANYNPSTVVSEVSSYINAANSANAVPTLAVYEIPNRDCGGASAGGAPDIASYNAWVDKFAQGLGNKTVIIVLETDSLALTTCLDGNALAERNGAISRAVTVIKAANRNAKVYLDAGHSAWNDAGDAAGRLKAAGVANADGFFSNVSNFRPLDEEINFGKAVIAALGDSSKRQVIDTSRNGNGPDGEKWCDPDGRLIGHAPTLDTGVPTVDAFLWVKPPGEADGCKGTPGSFLPDVAYELAGKGTLPPPTDTVPPRTTKTRKPPTGGTGTCTASAQVVSQKSGSYKAKITVKNTSSARIKWTVTWTASSGEKIVRSTVQRAVIRISGSDITAKAKAGRKLGPRATTSFTYTVKTSGSANPPSPTCTAA